VTKVATEVIVSLAGQTIQSMVEMAGIALEEGCDGIELRLDALARLDRAQVSGLVAATRDVVGARPIIATCRDKREGGILDHRLEDRLAAYAAAAQAGADWLDIELANYERPDVAEAIGQALGSRTRLILSSHSWDGPFADLQSVYRRSIVACPDAMPKLVYMANHICDCLAGMDLLHRADRQMTVFCMGQCGIITRILAGKLGCRFTYATCSGQGPTAPGQVPVGQLKGIYRLDGTSPSTQVYGLVGDPVGHSIGPYVHNAFLAELGLDAIYIPILVTGGRDGFFDFLDGFMARPWMDLRGLSVTLPHKQHALEFIKARGGTIEPLAQRIGAVNTVLIGKDGLLQGYNTDYIGAMAAICQGLGIESDALRGWPVAVVGAGGVSRAVVAGLRDVGADVRIFNRTLSKAKALAEEFGCTYGPIEDLPRHQVTLLVNCTSVGMSPNADALPVPEAVLAPQMAVFDTVYNPVQTKLLRVAAERGCRCIDGLSMYAHQASAQIRLFTGRVVDAGAIRRLALCHLQPG